MANVAHSTLTGSNLHENKGVAAASDNTVSTALTGATVWQKLTNSHMLYGQLFHVQEKRANNTSSSTITANNAWTKVALNTTVTNEISSASLTSSVISLPAGTYEIEGNITVNGTSGNNQNYKARLRNTTDSTTVIVGRKIWFSGGGATGALSAPCGFKQRVVLAGTKNLEFQIYQEQGSNGAFSNNVTVFSGEAEVYSDLYITKIS